MGWLSTLLRRPAVRDARDELAAKALDTIRRIVGGAISRDEIRARIAEGAHRGDFDDIADMLHRSDSEVEDFIKNG